MATTAKFITHSADEYLFHAEIPAEHFIQKVTLITLPQSLHQWQRVTLVVRDLITQIIDRESWQAFSDIIAPLEIQKREEEWRWVLPLTFDPESLGIWSENHYGYTGQWVIKAPSDVPTDSFRLEIETTKDSVAPLLSCTHLIQHTKSVAGPEGILIVPKSIKDVNHRQWTIAVRFLDEGDAVVKCEDYVPQRIGRWVVFSNLPEEHSRLIKYSRTQDTPTQVVIVGIYKWRQ